MEPLNESDAMTIFLITVSFTPVSRCGYTRQRFTVFQLFHDLLDGTIQLLILTVPLSDRVVVDQDVWIHTVVLHDPVAGLHVVAGEEGHTNIRTIHIGQRATDTNDTAPSACTDQLA